MITSRLLSPFFRFIAEHPAKNLINVGDNDEKSVVDTRAVFTSAELRTSMILNEEREES